MQEGFDYLEKQQFSKAISFFEQVLADEPDNRTAKICLGRAFGLTKETDKALDVFQKLAKQYPGDFEINLNVAEAYMWRKEFGPAAALYKDLIKQNEHDFVANQGLANALSAQKQNNAALKFISKALVIDPQNHGAKVSKKYILLGLAAASRSNLEYEMALKYIDQILIDFPLDSDAHINKAIIYLSDQKYGKAKDTYQYILEQDINTYEAHMGLAYLGLLDGNMKNAHMHVDHAIMVSDSLDSGATEKAMIQKANIAGADQNFDQAFEIIEQVKENFGVHEQTTMAQARFMVWSGKAKEGLNLYQSLEQKETSYDLLMGKAEAYRALKKKSTSINQIDQALELIPNQPDALRLRKTISIETASFFKTDATTSYDNGENEAIELNGLLSLGSSEYLNVYISAGFRETTFLDNQKARIRKFGLGAKRDLNHRISMTITGEYFTADDLELTTYKDWSGEGKLDIQLAHRHHVNVGYKRELQNYSSSLINSGLMMNHIFLNYNMSIRKGPGFYLQAIRTIQSDDNIRNLIFGSLYHQLFKKPALKLGVNYLNLSFQKRIPDLYFSPGTFNSLEVFAQSSNLDKKSNLIIYDFLLALGSQQIESNLRQSTLRVETSLGIRFSDKIHLLGKYQYSNAAQSTATGFQFNAASVAIKWIF